MWILFLSSPFFSDKQLPFRRFHAIFFFSFFPFCYWYSFCCTNALQTSTTQMINHHKWTSVIFLPFNQIYLTNSPTERYLQQIQRAQLLQNLKKKKNNMEEKRRIKHNRKCSFVLIWNSSLSTKVYFCWRLSDSRAKLQSAVVCFRVYRTGFLYANLLSVPLADTYKKQNKRPS